jgi:hypothetical protein
MDEQSSARVTWDVLVSSPLIGCRGCILADGWTALEFALHRGDQREGDCGCQHPRSHGERCVHSVAAGKRSDGECAQIRNRRKNGVAADARGCAERRRRHIN